MTDELENLEPGQETEQLVEQPVEQAGEEIDMDMQSILVTLQNIETNISKTYTCVWLTSGFICYYIIRKVVRSMTRKIGGGRNV